MNAKAEMTAEERAFHRAKYLTGLMWHAGVFVIINVFLWILDSWTAAGINWAHLVTIFWGLGLAFHALAYWVDGRQVEERMARHFLRKEEREQESATPGL